MTVTKCSSCWCIVSAFFVPHCLSAATKTFHLHHGT